MIRIAMPTKSPTPTATRARSPHRSADRNAGARLAGISTLLLCLGVCCGCNNLSGGDSTHKINGGVHVVAGTPASTAATVNGGVEIDDNAVVTSAATVNGSVHMGANAKADSLHVVNGGVVLEKSAHVSGAVQSVNGRLTLRDTSEVAGAVENVNGDIELQSAHVAGGIRTVNANISVLGSSRVEGGILVKHNSGDLGNSGSHVPRIVIGPGATVSGEMRFERPVKLLVSERATIGPVVGATVERYSGDEAPTQVN